MCVRDSRVCKRVWAYECACACVCVCVWVKHQVLWHEGTTHTRTRTLTHTLSLCNTLWVSEVSVKHVCVSECVCVYVCVHITCVCEWVCVCLCACAHTCILRDYTICTTWHSRSINILYLGVSYVDISVYTHLHTSRIRVHIRIRICMYTFDMRWMRTYIYVRNLYIGYVFAYTSLVYWSTICHTSYYLWGAYILDEFFFVYIRRAHTPIYVHIYV